MIRFLKKTEDDVGRVEILKILEVLLIRGAFFSPKTIVELKEVFEIFIEDSNLTVSFRCCSATLRLIFISQAHLQNRKKGCFPSLVGEKPRKKKFSFRKFGRSAGSKRNRFFVENRRRINRKSRIVTLLLGRSVDRGRKIRFAQSSSKRKKFGSQNYFSPFFSRRFV